MVGVVGIATAGASVESLVKEAVKVRLADGFVKEERHLYMVRGGLVVVVGGCLT